MTYANMSESGLDGNASYSGPTPDYVINSCLGRDGHGYVFLNGELIACSLDHQGVDYVSWQIERDMIRL